MNSLLVEAFKPLQGWTVVEEETAHDIGCDEDGEVFSSLGLDVLKVWAKAYHHNNYNNAMKAVTDNG